MAAMGGWTGGGGAALGGGIALPFPYGPPRGWTDVQVAGNEFFAMVCNLRWIPHLETAMSVLHNPAANDPRGAIGYKSLLDFCASTSWSGNPAGNAGAVCSSLSSDPRRIYFDYRRPTALRADKALTMLCRSRCYCEPRLTPRDPQNNAFNERVVPPNLSIYYYERYPARSLDVTVAQVSSQHNAMTLTSACFEYTTTNILTGASIFAEECYRVPQDLYARLRCRLLPTPVTRTFQLAGVQYQSVRSFCAASIFGGDSRGNAGFVCRQGARGPEQPMTLILRQNLMYTHPEFGADAIEFCYSNCACSAEELKEKAERQTLSRTLFDDIDEQNLRGPSKICRTSGMISPGQGAIALYGGGGSGGGGPLRITASGQACMLRNANLMQQDRERSESSVSKSTISINPDPDPALSIPRPVSPAAGTEQSADAAAMPLIPIPAEQPAPQRQRVCRHVQGSCTSNAQCGDGCRCYVDPSLVSPALLQSAQTASSFVRSVCSALVLQQWTQWMQQQQQQQRKGPGGRRRRLRRRDHREFTDPLMHDEMLCPCNVTYVSAACCGSADGVVWEHPSLKRGILNITNGDVDIG